MGTYILDSSVIVKWFKGENEENVENSLVLLRKLKNGELTIVVPDLLYFEIANVFANLKSPSLDYLLSAIEKIYSLPIEVVPPDLILSKEALRIARELKISAYDATYLVIAKQFGAKLVTEDTKLLSAGGEQVISLSDV